MHKGKVCWIGVEDILDSIWSAGYSWGMGDAWGRGCFLP